LNGSTVSAWADQSGRGNDYVQATASKQPTFGAEALFFDGTDDEMVASGLNLPAPGTTPTYIWLILSQSSWSLGDCIVGADLPANSNAYTEINQNPGTPSLRMDNSGVTFQSSSGLPVSTWGRVEAGFTNSTADFIKCRSTSVTGTNCGNNSGQTGRRLGHGNKATFYGNFGIKEILYASRIPTDAERAALDAYCTARYGPGLV
jgi:hypothetical protein